MKTKVLIVLAALLIVCLIPQKRMYDDGGTIDYAAVLYRVIVWHQLNSAYRDAQTDEIRANEPEYHTGTDVYVFPFNFGDKEWRGSR